MSKIVTLERKGYEQRGRSIVMAIPKGGWWLPAEWIESVGVTRNAAYGWAKLLYDSGFLKRRKFYGQYWYQRTNKLLPKKKR